MEPIDRPFRFTLDFVVAWALLALPAAILVMTGRWDFGPWYSEVAFMVIGPLTATFFIYGPVLLIRQVSRSGPRGWFVFRVFVTGALAAGILLAGLYFSGYYTEGRARLVGCLLGAVLTGCVSSRKWHR